MNYYEKHVGDWIKDTVSLDMTEDGAYNRLVDQCYQSEEPLPLDIKEVYRLARANKPAERKAVDYVLAKFFDKGANGYTQKRVQVEIARYSIKQNKAKASAEARWSKVREQSEGNANASETHDAQDMRTHSEGNAPRARPQTPDTRHQTPEVLIPPATAGCPIEPSPDADLTGESPPPPGLPDCPHRELLRLWAKHLPQLTQPRVWEGNRREVMRHRWAQASKPSAYSPNGYTTETAGIAWWDSFFAYIANDTRLPNGFGDDRNWRPDLEWVCKAANFQKIIDGRYDK